jgi:hypothetical protein
MLTGLRTEGSGFECRQRQEIFPSSSTSRPVEGPTQPHTQRVPAPFSPAVKRPSREAKVTL